MQSAARPIAALAVVGVLGLLAAGCSAGGTTPAPSPSRSASTLPSASASDTASALPTTGSGTGGTAAGSPTGASTTGTSGGSASGAGGVPSAFPGTGQTTQPEKDPAGFPATAVVTFAGWDTASKTLQAGGLVSGTVDTAGTCRFTAKKAGVVRTLTSTAAASASSVSCAQVAFPATQVSTGTWSITLQYAVGAKSTTSDPMTAEVP
ncbi:hypothetical protein [Curtobacterium sp. ISL-83]|uniref:hypothetical protein n=1 Tax=Curtobacterium sp. ISL-83 TaxID=2819145 RepID=UPI001BECE071|nr:hypothetical protein [Curtobacterium sp. ISL-83]MBT2503089.1 hypothetical protein [Curtobacterium sp. ISL-83]